jgi:hypothetical protein
MVLLKMTYTVDKSLAVMTELIINKTLIIEMV